MSGAEDPGRSEDLARAKEAARVAARARREQAHRDLGAAAPALFAEHFFHHLPLPRHGVIAGYVPLNHEADPGELLAEAGKRGYRTCLPRVARKASPLQFLQWAPGDPLAAGAHGTKEPMMGRPVLQPDIIIVPMLAYEPGGLRLGYGGGYYDRTLAALRAAGRQVLAVGLAYAEQGTDHLPEDPHDQRLDWLVTERRAISFASP